MESRIRNDITWQNSIDSTLMSTIHSNLAVLESMKTRDAIDNLRNHTSIASDTSATKAPNNMGATSF
jgi:hypothetical protein